VAKSERCCGKFIVDPEVSYKNIKTSERNVKKIKGCNVAFIGCVLVMCGFTTDVWINGWTDG
jgi:hypothetical protein